MKKKAKNENVKLKWLNGRCVTPKFVLRALDYWFDSESYMDTWHPTRKLKLEARIAKSTNAMLASNGRANMS